MNSTHQGKTQMTSQEIFGLLEQNFAKSHDLLKQLRGEVV